MKTGKGILILAAAGLVLTSACGRSPAEMPAKPESAAGTLKDFVLKNLAGEEVDTAGFRGKNFLLIVFGATWCPVCVEEIPELKEIHRRYQDHGLVILSVDVQENSRKVAAFAEKNALPYPVLLDETGEVAHRYGVRGIPFLVLADREGRVLYQGYRPRGGLEPLLEKMLAGDPGMKP